MISATLHGAVRLKQRSIPPLILDWLLDFGHCKRSRGADVYYFDKKSRRQLQQRIGTLAYKRKTDWLSAFAVISDSGELIIVGRRPKRL